MIELSAIEELLRRVIGLEPAALGPSTVQRAVRQRMAALGTEDAAAYHRRLTESEPEQQELIELVVVPETWFFRDPEAFAALARWARMRGNAGSSGTLRVLSMPCSTGEEPYSVAMALVEAGVTDFRIDALDVSERVLDLARQGVYGANSFRRGDLSFRDRHFVPLGKSYELDPQVRRHVHFRRSNLMDQVFLSGLGCYDAVFCRNLLIYLQTAAQQQVIRGLESLLNTDGWFFVGPAETGLIGNGRLAPARLPLAFAFRKVSGLPSAGGHATPSALAPKRRRPAARGVAVASPPKSPARNGFPAKPLAPFLAPAPVAEEPPLSRASRLADEGKLAEAAALCEAQLRTRGDSVEALYLLGLLRDAAGDLTQAGECYRKTLYLEPNHHEALMHLAYLKRRLGDTDAAQTLERRARRVQAKRTGAL